MPTRLTLGYEKAKSVVFKKYIFNLFFLALVIGHLTPYFYVPYNKYQEFGSSNLTQFIREIVAPESLFKDKAKEVQEKLIDFYETREKPQDADYKFYLDRYTQVKKEEQM